MNIEKDMNRAQTSGELAKIMKKSWTLSSLPSIANVKCDRHESEERKDNTEVIKIKSVSVNSVNSNEGMMNHMSTEIAMSGLNTDYDNDASPLPPVIAPPAKVTQGEAIDDGEGDEYVEEMRKQSTGSSKGTVIVQRNYSMNNEKNQEVIDDMKTNGNTLDHNTIMDNDEDIVNAVNSTNIDTTSQEVHDNKKDQMEHEYLSDHVNEAVDNQNVNNMHYLCGQCMNGYSEVFATTSCAKCDRNSLLWAMYLL